jgi:POT family proton-dependent oligopeptide transporter
MGLQPGDDVLTEAGTVSARDRSFFGHPAGLRVLLGTEALERFAYYGMQFLLVLYLSKHLLRPGTLEAVWGLPWLRAALGGLDGQPLASALFGVYGALIFLAPMAGGLIADRGLGTRRAIVTGGVALCLGHFLLMYQNAFLLAVLLIILGTGLFKANIASQVGALYTTGDRRRPDAFVWFLMSINVGGALAPLVIGTAGEKLGWHYGFALAGMGATASLVVYLWGLRHVREPLAPAPLPAAAASPGTDAPGMDRLVLVMPLFVLALTPNFQLMNAYLVWADREFALQVGGFEVPTTWLMMADGITGILAIATVLAFWRWWGRTRAALGDVAGILIGSVFTIAGMLVLSLAAATQGAGAKIGLGLPLLFHLLNALGFAHIMPSGMALFSRLTPASFRGTSMGLYYLTYGAASLLVGWLGGFLGTMSTDRFWLLHAACAATAGLGFLALWLLTRPAPAWNESVE